MHVSNLCRLPFNTLVPALPQSFNSKFFPHCQNNPDPSYCEGQWVSVPVLDGQAAHATQPNIFAWEANDIDTEIYKTACSWARGAESVSPESGSKGGKDGAGGGNSSDGNATGGTRGKQGDAAKRSSSGSDGGGDKAKGGAGRRLASDGGKGGSGSEQQGSGARYTGGVVDPPGLLLVEEGCNATMLALGKQKLPVPVFPVWRLGPAAVAALEASHAAFRDIKAALAGGAKP